MGSVVPPEFIRPEEMWGGWGRAPGNANRVAQWAGGAEGAPPVHALHL